MRNIIICLILITVSQTLAQAQPFVDSPSGNGAIYYNGGNVGIGYHLPQHTLHVEGTQRINSGSNISGSLLNVNSWLNNQFQGTLLSLTANTEGDGGAFTFLKASDWNDTKFELKSNGNLFVGGNVGIGYNSPQHSLHVEGTQKINSGSAISESLLSVNSWINNQYQGTLINLTANTEGNGRAFTFIKASDWNHTKFELKSNGDAFFNGNVGIGTTAPSQKLEVNGTIRSKEIKVEAAPWPDYVFADDYELGTLEETAAYIQQNKHLPEVPSASKVEGEGVNLGEMNMLLLKKIEELTLHLIEQNRQLQEQKNAMNEMKTQINYLMKE